MVGQRIRLPAPERSYRVPPQLWCGPLRCVRKRKEKRCSYASLAKHEDDGFPEDLRWAIITVEMKDRLVQALRGYLAAPIVTQEQVLYVLVSIRKLLDLSTYPKDKYLPARFICDWAVHTALSRSRWGKDVLCFFDNVINQAKSWDDLSSAEQVRFRRILGLEEIRNSLMDFLRENHVYPIALGNVFGWRVFLEQFVSLVQGCPLRLEGGKHVKEVTVEIRHHTEDPNLIDVEWLFTRVDDPRPFAWVAPMYVEHSDFHFGRDGKSIDEAFEARLAEHGYFFGFLCPKV